VLQCVAVCCSVLRVARWSVNLADTGKPSLELQCVAVCCSVLHMAHWSINLIGTGNHLLELQCVACGSLGSLVDAGASYLSASTLIFFERALLRCSI